MKILAASSTLNIKNGYGNFTHELVIALRDKGHEITLLLPKEDKYSEYDISGVDIERVLPKYIFRYKSRAFFQHLFWRYKTDKKFDLVHSLTEFPFAPLLCREARRRNIPFVAGTHGTYGVQPLAQFPERYAMKYVYDHAAAIHGPSEYTKSAIQREANKKYNITIVHNGVNYERFSNHVVKNNALVEKFKNRKVLLTVGELKSRKGQDLVLKTLPEIVKKHPDVLYVMAGYPSWKKYLEDLAEKSGVSDNIYIPGSVSDTEILDYFHLCDVYVHTPRVHNRFQFEGFGIVYLEAGACGKPSVGTDAGGIKDALLHEETGLVAPDGDVEKITEYILLLLDNKNLRVQYGENAKKYAKSHTWDIVCKQYIDLYNSVK